MNTKLELMYEYTQKNLLASDDYKKLNNIITTIKFNIKSSVTKLFK